MTLIVGILCSDGVVLASDSAATYGTGFQSTIGQQSVTKIQPIADRVVFGATGAIGMAQLIQHSISAAWSSNAFRDKDHVGAMQVIGSKIREQVHEYMATSASAAALIGNHAAASPVVCKSLVGMAVKGQARLFQFSEVGVPEAASAELPFIALGSGQPIADPFLAFLKRVLWRDRAPTVPEGRLVAAWTVQHTILTNPGGVGGAVQLVSLVKDSKGDFKVEVLDKERGVQEHLEAIRQAEESFHKAVRGDGSTTVSMPTPPKSD